jgi:hypothetical protein
MRKQAKRNFGEARKPLSAAIALARLPQMNGLCAAF